MTDEASVECFCVVDCAALHEIASATANLQAVYFAHLQSGAIGVPTVVFREFRELYEDEAAVLAPLIARKYQLTQAYRVGAASIADKLNSGFSRGSYDAQTDLYAASIALIDDLTLLTTVQQSSAYNGAECVVSTLNEWVALQS